MKRQRPKQSVTETRDLPPLIRLWLLRLLVSAGGINRFVLGHCFQEDELAQALDLGDWIDNEDKPFNQMAIRACLRVMHRQAEKEVRSVSVPRQLGVNVERLAQLVGLSATERRILEFTALIHTERLLENAAGLLGELSSSRLTQVFSKVLDVAEGEARLACGPNSTLSRSGLVSFNRNSGFNLKDKLDLLSDQFADNIVSLDADPLSLLRDTVRPATAATLRLDAYPHVATSIDLLSPYLGHALEVGRRGVNIFLYGAPGTGKSELAKVLADELNCELFEIASEDSTGDSVTGERRLRAFRAAQGFFGQRRVMLLFDETEDVFNDGEAAFGFKSTAQKCKAWINRMLEENSVPTFWLSNNVGSMDPAFIRRFDMVIELPIPPRKQRERIVQDACGGMLNAPAVSRIADSSSVAPALVTRAASVVALLHATQPGLQTGAAIEHLVNNTLVAQGHRPLRAHDPARLPDTYDPACVNANADLVAIANEMKSARSGRLCLYGPPGTGKTAYGRWLAQELDVPIQIRRASDLLGMYVGQSEKNIASAFSEAEKDGALLLIDEVDSFLQDRRGAQRSWEVSQVNEMLTQMESFAGVFIASTNLMDGLDQASLRRFDLKVKLGFLLPAQAWSLLERTCASLSLPPPASNLKVAMSRLDRLTPGDFAAVTRQLRFRPMASADAFVAALAAEVALKEGDKAVIGFV